jgi:hypothetical protein
VQRLATDPGGRWSPALRSAEVAAALDDATALALSLRGLGRVVIEALVGAVPSWIASAASRI